MELNPRHCQLKTRRSLRDLSNALQPFLGSFFSPDIHSKPCLAQPESFSSHPVTCCPWEGTSPLSLCPSLIPGLQELGFGCCSLISPCSRGEGGRAENCPVHEHPNLAVTANVCGSDPSVLPFFLLENGDNCSSTVTFMAEKLCTCVKCREGLLCVLFTQGRIPKREEKTTWMPCLDF